MPTNASGAGSAVAPNADALLREIHDKGIILCAIGSIAVDPDCKATMEDWIDVQSRVTKWDAALPAAPPPAGAGPRVLSAEPDSMLGLRNILYAGYTADVRRGCKGKDDTASQFAVVLADSYDELRDAHAQALADLAVERKTGSALAEQCRAQFERAQGLLADLAAARESSRLWEEARNAVLADCEKDCGEESAYGKAWRARGAEIDRLTARVQAAEALVARLLAPEPWSHLAEIADASLLSDLAAFLAAPEPHGGTP